MTQINFTTDKFQEEFLIKKLKLDRNSSLSLSLQIKDWLLLEENVQDSKEENQILRNKLLKDKLNNSDLIHTKLDLENQILQRQLSYHNNFDDEPSDEANRAIKKGIEKRELTTQEFENVTKYITIRKDSYNPQKWVGKCDICKEGESYETHYELINDMIRHLTTEHSKKVMEMR